MALTRDDLRHLLLVLEEFEPKYRAYIKEMERPEGDELHLNFSDSAPAEVSDGGWSRQEMEERKDELLELAPAIDEALVAAGVEPPALGHPPAIGGGLMARGVPSLLFNHGPVGLDGSGFAMPRTILQKVVSAKGALKVKLRRRPTSPVPRGRPRQPTRRGTNWDWINHPWSIAVGGVVLAAALAVVLHYTIGL